MNKDGFTLVELLAVVAILAILALLVTPAVMAIRQNTLERSLQAKFNQIIQTIKDEELKEEILNEIDRRID